MGVWMSLERRVRAVRGREPSRKRKSSTINKWLSARSCDDPRNSFGHRHLPHREMSQDAKFFQRGKIQVRIAMRVIALRKLTERPGVPPGTPGCGDEGQEVHKAKDGAEEDSREHYHGKRQCVVAASLACLCSSESAYSVTSVR